jgi:hypothetical protein
MGTMAVERPRNSGDVEDWFWDDRKMGMGQNEGMTKSE